MSGSPYFEDWKGVKLQLYIDPNVKAFGEVVAAVRVRPFKPRIKQQEPVPNCTDCGKVIPDALGRNARWMAAYTTKHYGCPLCAECAQKRKERATEAQEDTQGNEQMEMEAAE